jgi:hypothetical protein
MFDNILMDSFDGSIGWRAKRDRLIEPDLSSTLRFMGSKLGGAGILPGLVGGPFRGLGVISQRQKKPLGCLRGG